jgi:hypothetical protein
MITEWVSQSAKESWRSCIGYPYPPDQSELDKLAEELGLKKGNTADTLLDHIYKLWCDGKQWKREEKRKLNDDWVDWLGECDYDDLAYKKAKRDWVDSGRLGDYPEVPIKSITEFHFDVMGDGDSKLLEQYSGDINAEKAKKCIYRLFSPHELFADNYRLEVITTPEDDAIIGWSVTVD